MILGAVVTIICIPEVQEDRGHDSHSLETLAVGRARANHSNDNKNPGAVVQIRSKNEIRVLPLLNDQYDENYGDAKLRRRVWRCVSWRRAAELNDV